MLIFKYFLFFFSIFPKSLALYHGLHMRVTTDNNSVRLGASTEKREKRKTLLRILTFKIDSLTLQCRIKKKRRNYVLINEGLFALLQYELLVYQKGPHLTFNLSKLLREFNKILCPTNLIWGYMSKLKKNYPHAWHNMFYMLLFKILLRLQSSSHKMWENIFVQSLIVALNLGAFYNRLFNLWINYY